MLSTLVVSALLLLHTSFAVADSSGRKTFLPPTHEPRHRLLVRQSTCPAGSYMCADGTGCCDIGTTCGYRASDNYPVCKGGSCNGGPVCSSGLCCDLGYVCDEVAKLCALDTSGGSASSSHFSAVVLSSTIQSPATSIRVVTHIISSAPTPSGSGGESSSSNFFAFSDSTSSSEPTYAALTSGTDATPTSDSGNSGSDSRPTSIHSTLTTRISFPTGNSAPDLSANSGMKALAGVVAGALALVL